MNKSKTKQQLLLDNDELRTRLEEAEETLRAIRSGEVDALVVSGPEGDRLYTLEGADQWYRVLFETMAEGAATLGADGTILYCNRRLAEMLGAPLEKVIGSSMEEHLSPGDWQIFKNLDLSKEPHRREFDLKTVDGSRIPALISFGCLEIGVSQGTCMTVTDLTEQKRVEREVRKARDELETRVEERTQDLAETNEALHSEIAERKQMEIALRESELRWATTLSSIGDAVMATDIAGKITFMNTVSEELTGWTFREAAMKPVDEVFNIINEQTRRKVDCPVAKVLGKGMIAGLANHTILVRRDGTEVAIDDSGAPIKDIHGKTTGVVLIFRDITERRQAESKIQRQNVLQQSINKIFQEALTSRTDVELGKVCLAVIEDITQSKFSFIGEIGAGGLYEIAISNPERELCPMDDKAGHRRPPSIFKVHGLYGRILTDGKAFYTNDPASHPDGIGTPEGHPPLKAFLGVPLIRAGRTVGIIAVANREGGYRQEELEAIEALGPAITESFARKRAESALEHKTLELQELNESLEQRVRERTEELERSYQRLQMLSSQLIQAQEKERKRIAVELHDSLLSELAAMKYLFEARVMRLKKGEPADPKEFDGVTDIMQKVMKDARGIMNNLRPSILDEMGLIPTIKWLTQEYEKAYSHIQIRQQVEARDKDIPEILKVVIFRVLQEALNNFAKHGRGNLVELSLLKSADSLHLQIQDNGQGFDVENVQKGLGLESMRERVEVSGGEFRIESGVGRGTTIRAIWSLSGMLQN